MSFRYFRESESNLYDYSGNNNRGQMMSLPFKDVLKTKGNPNQVELEIAQRKLIEKFRVISPEGIINLRLKANACKFLDAVDKLILPPELTVVHDRQQMGNNAQRDFMYSSENHLSTKDKQSVTSYQYRQSSHRRSRSRSPQRKDSRRLQSTRQQSHDHSRSKPSQNLRDQDMRRGSPPRSHFEENRPCSRSPSRRHLPIKKFPHWSSSTVRRSRSPTPPRRRYDPSPPRRHRKQSHSCSRSPLQERSLKRDSKLVHPVVQNVPLYPGITPRLPTNYANKPTETFHPASIVDNTKQYGGYNSSSSDSAYGKNVHHEGQYPQVKGQYPQMAGYHSHPYTGTLGNNNYQPVQPTVTVTAPAPAHTNATDGNDKNHLQHTGWETNDLDLRHNRQTQQYQIAEKLATLLSVTGNADINDDMLSKIVEQTVAAASLPRKSK